ncbi:peroxidase 7-like [Senna tora]|uniref:Peroxidase n=1 Tax=Senna tora TaxID=362788 RepID=A0A834X8U1_9FABA|nr:peroxidase 7-like [Senna tora]
MASSSLSFSEHWLLATTMALICGSLSYIVYDAIMATASELLQRLLMISPLLLILIVHCLSTATAKSGENYDQSYDDDDDDKQYGSSSPGDTIFTLQVPKLDENTLDNLLSFGYYRKSCPQFESILHRKVKEWIQKDTSLGASLLRLHFHDCAVRGCDGSILLNHEKSERRAKASKTLRGFEVIDDIKSEVEKQCPKTVSCADILTAAARDATVELGGPYWAVAYGRKDGRVSIAEEGELVPMGHENMTSLIEIFQSMGLNVLDLVVLSGAHTIGRASCGSIQDRIYNYQGTGKPDPSIDPKYLNFLQRKCRWASDYVHLDATTPNTFDPLYFINLKKKMGLLYTDQLLYSDSRTSPLVSALVGGLPTNPSSLLFNRQFAVSMAKLANVGVLTVQDEGEIRTNCNFLNA